MGERVRKSGSAMADKLVKIDPPQYTTLLVALKVARNLNSPLHQLAETAAKYAKS